MGPRTHPAIVPARRSVDLQRGANQMKGWSHVGKRLSKVLKMWCENENSYHGAREQQVDRGPAPKKAYDAIATLPQEAIAAKVIQQVETRWLLS